MSGKINTVRVPRFHFDVTKQGRYIDYCWGKEAFEELAKIISRKLKFDGQYYRLHGMSYARQVWMYECCSNVDKQLAKRIGDRIPSTSANKITSFQLSLKIDDHAVRESPIKYVVDSDDDFQELPNFLDVHKGTTSLRDLINDKLQLVMDTIKCKVDHEKVLNRVMEIKVQTASITQLEKLIDKSDSAKEIDDAVEIKCHPIDQTEVWNTEMKIDVQATSVTELEKQIDRSENPKKNDADVDIKDHPFEKTERQIIAVHKSKVSGQTPVLPPRTRKPGRWKTSPYMADFGSRSGSSSRMPKIFGIKHPFIFDTIYGPYNDKLYSRFLDWVHEATLQKHAFNTTILDIFDKYADNTKEYNLTSQEEIIVEYINGFRLHASVPWHTVDHIFIPVNMDRIHWVLVVLSFNDRCLYVYDSYRSARHNAFVADTMRKLSKLIPTYLANLNFYKKRGIDFSSHPRYIDREEESFLDVAHVDDLPHQSVGSLDYGVYVAVYARYISHEKGVPPGFFDVKALHTRYAALLWSHGTQKIEKNT
ncbi:hypothetical protein FXO38_16916 [Capsicum annuum]|nr:hypothetical protein FXO38_16916 [Capsicum annuum]KAF3681689.1 hypothetical protein FXO37_02768 [Capsicum annuum]